METHTEVPGCIRPLHKPRRQTCLQTRTRQTDR